MLTWTHVINAAGAKLCADFFSRGQSKVGNRDSEAIVKAEVILWLEVTVIYAQRMAIIDSIEDLEKDAFDEVVVAEISTTVNDLREKVAVAGVVHDNVSVVEILDDAV